MKGYVQDLEGIALENDDFRRVLYTAKNCQLVAMALPPGAEIGLEVHVLDALLSGLPYRFPAAAGTV